MRFKKNQRSAPCKLCWPRIQLFFLNWDCMPLASVHCQTPAVWIGFSIKFSYAKPANVLPNSKKERLCLKIKAKCFSYF